MRRNGLATVRRAQLISTYGVGGLLPVEDASFMVAGIDRWNVSQPDIHEPRLERELRVHGFVQPPATDGDDVPVIRFPDWQTCPSCQRLAPRRAFCGWRQAECQDCQVDLVPSRFVVCCPNGHIDDFPYFRWLHAGNTPGEATEHEMTLTATGRSAALDDMVLNCSCGVRATSLAGIFEPTALTRVYRCRGRRPWLQGADEECGESEVRAFQRGAGNVWFSVTRSALSIPPWSEEAYRAINRYWTILRTMEDEEILTSTIRNAGLTKGTSCSIEELVGAVRSRQGLDGGGTETGSLREDEYQALLRGRRETSAGQDFVCVPAIVDESVQPFIERVMVVHRLREVRALAGFTRVLPDQIGGSTRVAALSAEPQSWLPAIEVLGEGLFLQLHTAALQSWESQDPVRARAADLNAAYQARCRRYGVEPDRMITPRLLLLHGLAHALIDQLGLDAGYPAASLRERLYCSEDMAGLLIYTATSDSAGSLGGLAAQGDSARFAAVLHHALHRVNWCSADPVCMETDATGTDSLNASTCHACLLLPETSCEEQNVLLDRALLVGHPDRLDLGYFASLLTRA